tara:strand:- start:145 stop:630 length:486 start_codon:yes stop_codon:yes gene_type:complete
MLLLEPLYDHFRDTHEAADELTDGLREHLVETATVYAMGGASKRLAGAVARRLGFEHADLDGVQQAPRTVILVAERIRRIGPVDAAIARLLHAGADRIFIVTPLAEAAVAREVDDRADVFVALRRAPRLGMVARWYDQWTMPAEPTIERREPRLTPMVAAV